jgi:ABC-type multidrug transport system fused ATPase/permease subunit
LRKIPAFLALAEVRPATLAAGSNKIGTGGICCAGFLQEGSNVMKVLLRVQDLNIAYRGAGSSRHHAVQNVSFEIGEGEVMGLLDESGRGKTSIALASLGFLPAFM